METVQNEESSSTTGPIVVLPEIQPEAPPRPVYDFSAFLVPGEDVANKPGFEAGRTQASGLCDGVIYMTGRKHPSEDHMILPDRFNEALRYLKPTSLDYRMMHPDRVGRVRPDGIWEIIKRNPQINDEIRETCKQTRQGINWMFAYSKRAMKAAMPANVGNWHVVKAADGIWAVIWHKEEDAK